MFIIKLLKGIVVILGGIIFSIGCIAALAFALACIIPIVLIYLLLFAGVTLISACDIDILDRVVDKVVKNLKSEIIDNK